MLGFVIGDSDMITGFRLVGVEGSEVNSPDEALSILNKALTRNDLAFIVVSEDYSVEPPIRKVIDKVRHERRSPLILELPGSEGKVSEVKISDVISKTLGVKL